ncbi:MAG TPA: helix-turn-helix transcriptional regulator [Anaerolineae bacterium]|nr:helix-turn-helix transcriptional regulator [Anaerolineae bacterium]
MFTKNQYKSQSKLFKVLSHPVRLAIMDILRHDEACVCHLVAALGQRQAYVSQQLMVLRDAKLVEIRRDGWNIYYRVTHPEIYNVIDAIYDVIDEAKPIPPPTVLPFCTCPHCRGEDSPDSHDLKIKTIKD